MTKKILTGIAVVAVLSLMATTVLAGPGARNERRHGWKTTRPTQMRIVPRVKKVRFDRPWKKQVRKPGFSSKFRNDNGRGRGFCPNYGGRF